MGGDLEKIRFSNRQIASFMFTGPNLHKHDKAYINGQGPGEPAAVPGGPEPLESYSF